MTQEQLIINMCKHQGNYINLVRARAYKHTIQYNNWVNYIQDMLKATREHYKATGKITLGKTYWNKKKHKSCYWTIYSKAPKFTTFKQQCAIYYRTLESKLKSNLEFYDFMAQEYHKAQQREKEYRSIIASIEELDELDI